MLKFFKKKKSHENPYLAFLKENEGKMTINKEIAINENLVTKSFVESLPNVYYHLFLFSSNGLAALREKLITQEEIISMPTSDFLFDILTDQSLNFLRKQKELTDIQSAESKIEYN